MSQIVFSKQHMKDVFLAFQEYLLKNTKPSDIRIPANDNRRENIQQAIIDCKTFSDLQELSYELNRWSLAFDPKTQDCILLKYFPWDIDVFSPQYSLSMAREQVSIWARFIQNYEIETNKIVFQEESNLFHEGRSRFFLKWVICNSQVTEKKRITEHIKAWDYDPGVDPFQKIKELAVNNGTHVSSDQLQISYAQTRNLVDLVTIRVIPNNESTATVPVFYVQLPLEAKAIKMTTYYLTEGVVVFFITLRHHIQSDSQNEFQVDFECFAQNTTKVDIVRYFVKSANGKLKNEWTEGFFKPPTDKNKPDYESKMFAFQMIRFAWESVQTIEVLKKHK